jgi:hypothetical protein
MADFGFRDRLITACSEFSRSFTRIAARGIFFDAVRPYCRELAAVRADRHLCLPSELVTDTGFAVLRGLLPPRRRSP